MPINEPVRGSEQVLKVLGKEGAMRIAPSDTQCCATNTRGNRCRKEIWYDEDTDTWSSMCVAHSEQNEKARRNEAKKVKVFQRRSK